MVKESNLDAFHMDQAVSANMSFAEAVNTDIKQFCLPILSRLLESWKLSCGHGDEVQVRPIVDVTSDRLGLQIVRVTNVGAPKGKGQQKQADGRGSLLKIGLTDGHVTCQALLLVPNCSRVSLQTAPGTKLALNLGKSIQIRHSFLLLEREEQFDILGGHVEHLISRWQTANDCLFANRKNVTSKVGGPPRWSELTADPLASGESREVNASQVKQKHNVQSKRPSKVLPGPNERQQRQASGKPDAPARKSGQRRNQRNKQHPVNDLANRMAKL